MAPSLLEPLAALTAAGTTPDVAPVEAEPVARFVPGAVWAAVVAVAAWPATLFVAAFADFPVPAWREPPAVAFDPPETL